MREYEPLLGCLILFMLYIKQWNKCLSCLFRKTINIYNIWIAFARFSVKWSTISLGYFFYFKCLSLNCIPLPVLSIFITFIIDLWRGLRQVKQFNRLKYRLKETTHCQCCYIISDKKNPQLWTIYPAAN